MQIKHAFLLAIAVASDLALATTTTSKSSTLATTTSKTSSSSTITTKKTTTTSTSTTKKTSTTTTSKKTSTSSSTPIPTPTCGTIDTYADIGYKRTFELNYVGRKSQFKLGKDPEGGPTVYDTIAGDFQLCHAIQACADLTAVGRNGASYANFNLLDQDGVFGCVASYSGYEYSSSDGVYQQDTIAAYGFTVQYGCNWHYSGCDDYSDD